MAFLYRFTGYAIEEYSGHLKSYDVDKLAFSCDNHRVYAGISSEEGVVKSSMVWFTEREFESAKRALIVYKQEQIRKAMTKIESCTEDICKLTSLKKPSEGKAYRGPTKGMWMYLNEKEN